ncbi:MAG: hypothetical protein VKM17_02840 [Cyanobacteriota bacterium]|nr:hypothetical protein [Cyanobacteriota bacterium]
MNLSVLQTDPRVRLQRLDGADQLFIKALPGEPASSAADGWGYR